MKRNRLLLLLVIVVVLTMVLASCKCTHDEYTDWTITIDPTLTTTGTATRKCVKCSEPETKTLPALSDTSVWTKSDSESVAPQHGAAGKDVYTSEYGKVEVTLDAIDHTFDQEVVGEEFLKQAATCTTAAVYFKSCSCGAASETLTFEHGTKLGHDVSHHPAVAATCETDGTKEHWTCSREEGKYFTSEECTTEVEDGIVITKLGHDAGTGKITVTEEPTLDAAGKATFTCVRENCPATDKLVTLDLAKLSDTTVWTVETTPADYESPETTTYTHKIYDAIVIRITSGNPLAAPYANKTYTSVEFSNTSNPYPRTSSVTIGADGQGTGSSYPLNGVNVISDYNMSSGSIKYAVGATQYTGFVDNETGIIVMSKDGFTSVLLLTPYGVANVSDCYMLKLNDTTKGIQFLYQATESASAERINIFVANNTVYFNVSFVDESNAEVVLEYNLAPLKASNGDKLYNHKRFIVKADGKFIAGFEKTSDTTFASFDIYVNDESTELYVKSNGEFALGDKSGTFTVNTDDTLDAYVIVKNQKVEHYTITLNSDGTFAIQAKTVSVTVHYNKGFDSVVKDLFVGCVVDRDSLLPVGSNDAVGEIYEDEDYLDTLINNTILASTREIWVQIVSKIVVTIHGIEESRVEFYEGQLLYEKLPPYVVGETKNGTDTFAGWSTDELGQNTLEQSAVANSQITDIYAQWQGAPAGSSIEKADEITLQDNKAALSFATTQNYQTYYHKFVVDEDAEITFVTGEYAANVQGDKTNNGYGRYSIIKVTEGNVYESIALGMYTTSTSNSKTTVYLKAGTYYIESHVGGKVTGTTVSESNQFNAWGSLKLNIYYDTHASVLTAIDYTLGESIVAQASNQINVYYKATLSVGKYSVSIDVLDPAGWNTVAVLTYDASTKKETTIVTATSNVKTQEFVVTEQREYYFVTYRACTFTVKQTAMPITVIFDHLVDGVENKEVSVIANDKLGTAFYQMPSSVTNGNKVFVGWYTLDGTDTGEWGDEVTADTVISEATTVYAKWAVPHVLYGSYKGYEVYKENNTTANKTITIDANGNASGTKSGAVVFDSVTGYGKIGNRFMYADPVAKALVVSDGSETVFTGSWGHDAYFLFIANTVTLNSNDIITWNNQKSRIAKFVVDGQNRWVYADENTIAFDVNVEIRDINGDLVTSNTQYKKYGNVVNIGVTGGLSVSKVYNGTSWGEFDGYQGTYTDASLGAISVDGIGKVTVDGTSYAYTILSEGVISAVIDGQYYEINNMSDNTCSAVAFNANVTYIVEHGAVSDTVICTPSINVEITLPVPVMDEGYMFFGWMDASGNKVATYTFTKDETVTFTAIVLQPSTGESVDTAEEITLTGNTATINSATTENFQTYYAKFVLAETTDVTIKTAKRPVIQGPTTSLSTYRGGLAIVALNESDGSRICKGFINVDVNESMTVALDAGTYYIEYHVGGKVTGTTVSASNQFDGWGSFDFSVYIDTHSLPQTALTYELGTELVAAPSFGLTVCYEVLLGAGEYTFTMIEGEGDVFSRATIYALNENTGALASSSTAVVNSTTAKTKTFSITKAGKYYITTDKACKFSLVLNQTTDPSDINFAGKTFEKTEETSDMAGYYKHYYQVVFTSATEGYIKTYKEDIEWYQGPEEEVQVNFTAELDNGTITFKFSDGKADIVATYTETTIKFPSSCSISKMNGKTVTMK